ncbi:MAG: ABC transporter ATP-binding protein [Gammaproteobacteria bacterium]|nr:ABC transporter ATP-binding protein [Gammaproteobacteria bacterium]
MSFIEINNVCKHYDKTVVLERVNAKVEHGEFITLVGASGCGKTTFLKMLLGTEVPSRGSITLHNRPIAQEPGPDRGIVFQRYSVFPHLTALQNLILAHEFKHARLIGKLFGQKRNEAIAQAYTMLTSVGLEHADDRYPHQLSGGMQQRLAIAQAFMQQPEVLLLDEPFGALDPGIRGDMHQLVLDIWGKTAINIFMITHDLKEGFYLGTRLWVFDKIRHDPQAPHAYGATITYDIPLGHTDRSTYKTIHRALQRNKPVATRNSQ